MSECRAGNAPANRPGTTARRACWADAVATIRYGCVHEHVNQVDMCERHAGRVESGLMFCERCWHHDDPHRCPIIGQRLEKVSTQ